MACSTISVTSVTRSAQGPGDPTSLTFIFTPGTTIVAGNYVEITVPTDAATSSGGVSCTDGSSTSVTCSWSGTILTLTASSSGWCGTSGCAGGSAVTIVADGFTNPAGNAISPTSLTFESKTELSSGTYTTDSMSGTAYVSPGLDAGVLTVTGTISRSVPGGGADETGGTTTWSFTVSPEHAIVADTKAGFRVYFPEDVGYFTSAAITAMAGDSSADTSMCSSSCPAVADATDSTMIDYIDVYACTGGCAAATPVTFTITVINSYHTGTPASLEFTV